MFDKLFAERGLSLDRLRALLAVAAAGSIVKATGGDAVKQSQFSRQIKELEDFFRARLAERDGKAVRLTASGKELARISRFFLLGLSNFQRGCLAEEQTFRIGAGATFIERFLLPALSRPALVRGDTRYIIETVSDDEIERRLHHLTLDFGVTTQPALSRPLQVKPLFKWRLQLCVPTSLYPNVKSAAKALAEKRLPLILAEKELQMCDSTLLKEHQPRLICDTFIQALKVMQANALASLLPDFLVPELVTKAWLQVRAPSLDAHQCRFHLAWNPRLLRLNPHAIRGRDFLQEHL